MYAPRVRLYVAWPLRRVIGAEVHLDLSGYAARNARRKVCNERFGTHWAPPARSPLEKPFARCVFLSKVSCRRRPKRVWHECVPEAQAFVARPSLPKFIADSPWHVRDADGGRIPACSARRHSVAKGRMLPAWRWCRSKDQRLAVNYVPPRGARRSNPAEHRAWSAIPVLSPHRVQSDCPRSRAWLESPAADARRRCQRARIDPPDAEGKPWSKSSDAIEAQQQWGCRERDCRG